MDLNDLTNVIKRFNIMNLYKNSGTQELQKVCLFKPISNLKNLTIHLAIKKLQ